MLFKLPRDTISLFPRSSEIIETFPGNGPKVWSPRAHRVERIRKRRSQYLCRIDPSGHASIFLVLSFIFMAYFLTYVSPRVSVDLPRTEHPTWMPGAIREDAMHVGVTRNGGLYFRTHRISPDELPDQIRRSLRAGAENQIYISADARVMYRDMKTILDRVRLAGVERVSFLAVARPQ